MLNRELAHGRSQIILVLNWAEKVKESCPETTIAVSPEEESCRGKILKIGALPALAYLELEIDGLWSFVYN
jgi:hypothetical protein